MYINNKCFISSPIRQQWTLEETAISTIVMEVSSQGEGNSGPYLYEEKFKSANIIFILIKFSVYR